MRCNYLFLRFRGLLSMLSFSIHRKMLLSAPQQQLRELVIDTTLEERGYFNKCKLYLCQVFNKFRFQQKDQFHIILLNSSRSLLIKISLFDHSFASFELLFINKFKIVMNNILLLKIYYSVRECLDDSFSFIE